MTKLFHESGTNLLQFRLSGSSGYLILTHELLLSLYIHIYRGVNLNNSYSPSGISKYQVDNKNRMLRNFLFPTNSEDCVFSFSLHKTHESLLKTSKLFLSDYHHHGVSTTRISLTFSHHPSLSTIILGKSSRWQSMSAKNTCPVCWVCRLHRLLLCKGSKTSSIECPDMTLNNLMVRFQWCWSFGECRVPLSAISCSGA